RLACGIHAAHGPARKSPRTWRDSVPHREYGKTRWQIVDAGGGRRKALPVRDRPSPWMAKASVQGCIHSVSRTGSAFLLPAPAVAPTFFTGLLRSAMWGSANPEDERYFCIGA